MPDEQQKSDASTRARNMAKRRALILQHARAIIASEGFDALKIRDIAAGAGVTVPTIYNLIGGKAEILKLIIDDLVDRLTAVQEQFQTDDVVQAFESQINALADMIAEDEAYFRAAFIAGDRSGLFEQQSKDGFYARSVKMPIAICRKAQKSGALKGQVSAELLGRQIYGCYRLARQDWMNGYFDLNGFRRQAITGVYLCLAADASPEIYQDLQKRLLQHQ